MKTLEDYIISIPDFPKEGIIFRDVTGALQEAEGLQLSIDAYKKMLEGVDFDVIVGAEARGFIFGSILSYIFNKPFVPARKPNKLPRETVSYEYELEYGTDTIEMHKDAIKPGQKVVIVDDLLATGGTVAAISKLVDQLQGDIVKCVFLIELVDLKGRDKLEGLSVESAVVYEGE